MRKYVLLTGCFVLLIVVTGCTTTVFQQLFSPDPAGRAVRLKTIEPGEYYTFGTTGTMASHGTLVLRDVYFLPHAEKILTLGYSEQRRDTLIELFDLANGEVVQTWIQPADCLLYPCNRVSLCIHWVQMDLILNLSSIPIPIISKG